MKKTIIITIALLLTIGITAQTPENKDKGVFLFGARMSTETVWITQNVEQNNEYDKEDLGTVNILMHQYKKNGIINTYWSIIPQYGSITPFELQEGVMISEEVTEDQMIIRTVPFISFNEGLMYAGIIYTSDSKINENNEDRHISLWHFKNGHVMTFTDIQHLEYYKPGEFEAFQFAEDLIMKY